MEALLAIIGALAVIAGIAYYYLVLKPKQDAAAKAQPPATGSGVDPAGASKEQQQGKQ